MERSVQVGTSMELLFSRKSIFPAFQVMRKKRICYQTAFPPKPSGQVGFNLILKVVLLPGPILPPMERSVQVGTSLELWLSRNSIFPVFAVLPKKPICHHTAFPPKPSAIDGFQLILKVLLLPGPVLPPMERVIQVGTSLELWFTRKNIFPAFPSSEHFPIYHYTAFPPKSSAIVGFQLILNVILLVDPALLPMEWSVQVGTVLELRISRNNIFPGFPVIRKFPILIKLPFHRNRPRKSDLPGILKVFLLGHSALPPMERAIQVGTSLEDVRFEKRNNINTITTIHECASCLHRFCFHSRKTRSIYNLVKKTDAVSCVLFVQSHHDLTIVYGR